ncbi:MAG: ornithine aminomutase [Ruminococcaceae bacterium]|nr:ornithine aminomutase [Oscillospiraceae bacterium]
MRREDDYQVRRAHLADLTDEQLYDKFWSLIGEIVDPLLELGKEHTSASVERSVLLRMGFSSLEAKAIVEGCVERSLLGHGAGHVVYKLAKAKGLGVREAGVELAAGKCWDEVVAMF